jgi:hypothetical protein
MHLRQFSKEGTDVEHENNSRKVRRMRFATAMIAGALLSTFLAAAPALAAPVATVQASSHGLAEKAISPAVGAGKYKPLIKVEGCGSSNATWVHITTSEGTTCYGDTGILSFSGNNTLQVCAGNNYGKITYVSPYDGTIETWPFAPGYVINFGTGADVLTLTITGWLDSDSC